MRLRRALAEPKRAIDVFGALFARPIEGSELLGMATGESLAHLNHLVARGEASRELAADGALRYQMRAGSGRRPRHRGSPGAWRMVPRACLAPVARVGGP